jgi:hypothetical protein
VIPVIIPPPATRETVGTGVFVPAVVEEPISDSPPSIDTGSGKDGTDGAEALVASEHGRESEAGQAAVGNVAQPAKPVVTEELKAKVVKQ